MCVDISAVTVAKITSAREGESYSEETMWLTCRRLGSVRSGCWRARLLCETKGGSLGRVLVKTGIGPVMLSLRGHHGSWRQVGRVVIIINFGS